MSRSIGWESHVLLLYIIISDKTFQQIFFYPQNISIFLFLGGLRDDDEVLRVLIMIISSG